ncbi:calmodulin-like [Haliotis rufescens]|uniref:calmodulin-like n=1 Tax=Haliotis rufescens TaxID=6454 RepID=UPI00201EB8C5|nr:calmodulin-like [Haliotis rufescens]
MLGIIVLMLVASALGAPTTPAPGSATTLDLAAIITTAFNSLDVNNNGQVELSEFYSVFDKYDTNNDHEMSIQEYIQNTNVTAAIAKEVFKFIDKDNDDSINRSETNGIFKMYDTNDNGVITIQEFISVYTRIYNDILKDLYQGQTIPASTST